MGELVTRGNQATTLFQFYNIPSTSDPTYSHANIVTNVHLLTYEGRKATRAEEERP